MESVITKHHEFVAAIHHRDGCWQRYLDDSTPDNLAAFREAWLRVEQALEDFVRCGDDLRRKESNNTEGGS